MAGAAISNARNPAIYADKPLIATVEETFGEHRSTELWVTVPPSDTVQILLDASQGARTPMVGRHGQCGFSDLILGSVNVAGIETHPCPVLALAGNTPVTSQYRQRAITTRRLAVLITPPGDSS